MYKSLKHFFVTLPTSGCWIRWCRRDPSSHFLEATKVGYKIWSHNKL